MNLKRIRKFIFWLVGGIVALVAAALGLIQAANDWFGWDITSSVKSNIVALASISEGTFHTILLLLILLLILVWMAFRVSLIMWPQARQNYIARCSKLQKEIARRSEYVPIGDEGDLASSIIVYTRRSDDHELYFLLEAKQLENRGTAPKEKMYPGRRVLVRARPERAALDYVRDRLGLRHVKLSEAHHEQTDEAKYANSDLVTIVPRPFRILVENQPQRGDQTFNYDMIYVGNCPHNGGQLPDVPAHCEWRRLEEIRGMKNAVIPADAREVILEAAAVLQAQDSAPASRSEQSRVAQKSGI